MELALRIESLDDVDRGGLANAGGDPSWVVPEGKAALYARSVDRLAELAERLRRVGPGARIGETLESPLVFHDRQSDRLILQLRRLEERHSCMVERAFELLEEVITELEDLS